MSTSAVGPFDVGDRLKVKIAVSTAVSNMGLLDKLPLGRIDFLTDSRESWPPEFLAAVCDTWNTPSKGCRQWRVCRDYVVHLKVPLTRETDNKDNRLPPAGEKDTITDET